MSSERQWNGWLDPRSIREVEATRSYNNKKPTRKSRAAFHAAPVAKEEVNEKAAPKPEV